MQSCELHAFFEDQYHARFPTDDATFARVADALGPTSRWSPPTGTAPITTPSVTPSERATATEMSLRSKSRSGVRVRDVTEDRCLCTYEEWQSDTETTGRVSTAFFIRDEGAPAGVRWRHLQETWLETSKTEH